MAVVVLDTSVIIALRNEKDAHHGACMAALSNFDGEIFISVVTLIESMIHALKKVGSRAEVHAEQLSLSVDQVVSLDQEIALSSAGVRAKTGLRLPDSVISATALACKAQLWTFDAKLAKVTPGARLLS